MFRDMFIVVPPEVVAIVRQQGNVRFADCSRRLQPARPDQAQAEACESGPGAGSRRRVRLRAGLSLKHAATRTRVFLASITSLAAGLLGHSNERRVVQQQATPGPLTWGRNVDHSRVTPVSEHGRASS